MQRLKNWWSRTTKLTISTPTSPEWSALKAALVSRELIQISPCMMAWSKLPECAWSFLSQEAQRLEYTGADLDKLVVLFENYTDNIAVAFPKAQEYIEKYGFDADMHIISVNILYRTNQFEDALRYLGNHAEVEATLRDRADYWQMVGVIRWSMNHMEALESAVDRVVALAPDHGAIIQTALGMYVELGALEKIEHWRAVVANRPDWQGYAHSLIRLSLGEMEDGWRQMELRYDFDEAHRFINLGLKSYPRWTGEDLNGCTLLVSGEQGLGDVIQMARYLPELKGCGAKLVRMEVQPEALTLLQHSFPDIPMVERVHGVKPAIEFDKWVAMMSLPHCLGMWGKNTPGQAGYLQVPLENADYWIERVKKLNPSKLPKIGLAWSGNPEHRADRRRSIPFAMMMAQVRSVNAIFFALQTKVPDVMPPNVANVTEELITLADTAALVEQMDLVITVDTSVVHVAGALGKQTWLLLPKRYEWRWGLEGEENDWYDSVTVIRQAEHAKWQPVLMDVFERRLPQLINL